MIMVKLKKSNFFIALFVFAQLVSCQSKKETGFVLENRKLYYNSKEIALGMPIEKFTDAMGMYDRISIDSSGGFTNRSWYWKKEKYEAYIDDGKIVFRVKESNYIEYNSMEEVISKYGKYDSIEESKSPLRIDKLFIWDQLGITLAADRGNDKLIGNIHLQVLYPTKFEKLDLGLVKTYEEERGLPVTKEVKENRENDKKNISQCPKKEYSGNFTYNGKTINFKEIGYTGWKKAIDKLGISGSDYDPPGDSPQWSRSIKDIKDMYVTLERYSNENKYDELSPENLGKIDCIESIAIWNFDDYGETKKE
jgi:hypothetical protein